MMDITPKALVSGWNLDSLLAFLDGKPKRKK
jgi:hypothetical protein